MAMPGHYGSLLEGGSSTQPIRDTTEVMGINRLIQGGGAGRGETMGCKWTKCWSACDCCDKSDGCGRPGEGQGKGWEGAEQTGMQDLR